LTTTGLNFDYFIQKRFTCFSVNRHNTFSLSFIIPALLSVFFPGNTEVTVVSRLRNSYISSPANTAFTYMHGAAVILRTNVFFFFVPGAILDSAVMAYPTGIYRIH